MKSSISFVRGKQTASFKIVGLMLAIAPLWLTLTAAYTAAHAQTFTALVPGLAGDAPGIIAQGRDGDLYSTSAAGFAFKLTPKGGFTNLAPLALTFSGLTLGTDGNYYGTAELQGAVFKMTATGNVTTLAETGVFPHAPPIEGFDGNFYGTTSDWGGGSGNGTVYRITPSGGFTNIHSFAPDQGPHNFNCDVALFFTLNTCPNGPLVQGSDGYLYGTTFFGGRYGLGSVFKISYSGKFTTLYSFDLTHGANPLGPMVQGNDGNFYGTTTSGYLLNDVYGGIFKITPAGDFTVLHEFNGGSDGHLPFAGLIQASDGNIYGATNAAGALHGGTLYRISPAGKFAVVYNFDPATYGFPETTPVQHTNGKLYGETGGDCWGGAPTCSSPAVYSLDLGLKPFVRFLPEAGKAGDTIEILGQGFTGTSAVSFNGIPAAAFTVVSDTYLTAIVPFGAKGTISVETPGGTLNSSRPFVNRSADLFLRIWPSPATVHQGDLLTYAFPVWNLGPDNADLEVLNTQVPAGTTFDYIRISGTPGLGTCTHPPYQGTGQIVCHENASMAPNTTWTVRLTVKVTAPSGTVITENAATMADTFDPNMANNAATVSIKVQ
jgi:uncharacterized repeat protein (TIGR03803 family)